jgi:hypothetical protein
VGGAVGALIALCIWADRTHCRGAAKKALELTAKSAAGKGRGQEGGADGKGIAGADSSTKASFSRPCFCEGKSNAGARAQCLGGQ